MIFTGPSGGDLHITQPVANVIFNDYKGTQYHSLSLSLALILPDSGSICKGDNKQLISGKNNACLFTFFRIKWGIPNSLCPYFGQTLESQIRANMGLPAMVSSEIYLQWCLVQVGKGINHPYRLPFWQGGSL